jgi:hypothetical protein
MVIGRSLVILTLASACAATPSRAVSTSAGTPVCDLPLGRFKQTSSGPCGASTWTFVRNNLDGRYRATEHGCANATGIAAYDGSTLVVQFQYDGGAGVYTWPLDGQCRGGPGTVSWTSGSLAGQTVASALELAP